MRIHCLVYAVSVIGLIHWCGATTHVCSILKGTSLCDQLVISTRAFRQNPSSLVEASRAGHDSV